VGVRRLLLGCAIFATAFGVVEGAVVVYLRELYYPEGFAFPLKEMPPRILAIEIVREAATLVLLLGVALLAERRPVRRFAVFALCFGVWDITYYLALEAFLGWPPHPLTWDILFLIPLPWTGPVLAPVLVSLALVAGGVAILRGRLLLRPLDWAVESAAGLLVLASFLWNVPRVAAPQAPSYPWWLFVIGYGGGVLWVLVRGRGGAAGRGRGEEPREDEAQGGAHRGGEDEGP
jgi:hypothetical protein